jgi:hypothetical protein
LRFFREFIGKQLKEISLPASRDESVAIPSISCEGARTEGRVPIVKQEHFELATVCEEVANHIEDRLTGG